MVVLLGAEVFNIPPTRRSLGNRACSLNNITGLPGGEISVVTNHLKMTKVLGFETVYCPCVNVSVIPSTTLVREIAMKCASHIRAMLRLTACSV